MKSARKIFALSAFSLSWMGVLGICFSILKDYPRVVPLQVGPYKQALLGLGLLCAALAAGFWFRPFSRRTCRGALGLLAGAGWFYAISVLSYRSPDSAGLGLLRRWMPIGLALLLAGILEWGAELLPDFCPCPGQWARPLLCALFLLILLLPALSGSFNWDDAFFSVQVQAMRLRGESVLQLVGQEALDYILAGRINPFATFHYLVFYWLPSALAYQVFLLCLTLLDFFLFARFLRNWQGENLDALSVLLLTALCFQLRLYHDPLNSYYGLMQMMFAELLLCLHFFLKRLRGGGIHTLLLSLLFFLTGLMSYEMFFPMTALVLWLAWEQKKSLKEGLRSALPHLLTALTLFALTLLLRRMNISEQTVYTGTTFSLNPAVILRTFLNQVSAAFPLSYRLAGNALSCRGELIPWGEAFPSSFSALLEGLRWQDGIAAGILLVLLASARKAKLSKNALIFPLLLVLLPGMVISLSEKYQGEIMAGMGYLPVFFSCFGMGLLLYVLCSRIPPRFAPALCGAACAVLLITAQDNRRVSGWLTERFYAPRAAGEAALQAGILGDEPSENELILSSRTADLWEEDWQGNSSREDFYSLNARRPVRALSVRDYVADIRADSSETWIYPRETGLFDYEGNAQGGFAKFGRLREAGIAEASESLQSALVSDVRIYADGRYMNNTDLVYTDHSGKSSRIPLNALYVLNRTADGGTLYKLDIAEPVLFDSIGLVCFGAGGNQ